MALGEGFVNDGREDNVFRSALKHMDEVEKMKVERSGIPKYVSGLTGPSTIKVCVYVDSIEMFSAKVEVDDYESKIKGIVKALYGSIY